MEDWVKMKFILLHLKGTAILSTYFKLLLAMSLVLMNERKNELMNA